MDRIFYTDGSTLRNGKPDASGAYAWVEVSQSGDLIRRFASNEDVSDVITTNQRMELLAVISALHHCDKDDSVAIYSDSAYVINGMTDKWYKHWDETGKTSMGNTPKNLDLWRMLVRASSRMSNVKWIHIKGHSNNRYNELCDHMAGALAKDPRLGPIYAEQESDI